MGGDGVTCAICGQGDHRFGTTDSERDYDAMACVNMLLPALAAMKTANVTVWEMLDRADDLLVEMNPESEHDERCWHEALDLLHEAMEILILKEQA